MLFSKFKEALFISCFFLPCIVKNLSIFLRLVCFLFIAVSAYLQAIFLFHPIPKEVDTLILSWTKVGKKFWDFGIGNICSWKFLDGM